MEKNTQNFQETIEKLHDIANTVTNLTDRIENMLKEKEIMNNDAVTEAREKVEAEIRKRGGKMHTVSKINTYKIGNEIVVRLDDVLELCRVMKDKYRKGTEVGYLCDDEKAKIHAFLALNHLQTVLLSDELSKVDSIDDHKRIIAEHSGKNKKPLEIPKRYAVGRKYDDENDYWMFYLATVDGKPTFTNRPCMAMKYNSYKQAEACRDFLDDGDWDVIDMWNALTESEQIKRQIFGDTEWDDGNENAIRLDFGCDVR